jgi:hypothetical protein
MDKRKPGRPPLPEHMTREALRADIDLLLAKVAEMEQQLAELRPTPRDSYMMWVRRVNNVKVPEGLSPDTVNSEEDMINLQKLKALGRAGTDA